MSNPSYTFPSGVGLGTEYSGKKLPDTYFRFTEEELRAAEECCSSRTEVGKGNGDVHAADSDSGKEAGRSDRDEGGGGKCKVSYMMRSALLSYQQGGSQPHPNAGPGTGTSTGTGTDNLAAIVI